MIKSLLSFIILTCILLLTSCGVNNNVTVTTINGACPSGTMNGPYCMAVKITNNGGGQNYITSTNYPITNLTISVSGADNIQTPTTTTTMDPNHCSASSISPGEQCTFYLKIYKESYATSAQESIVVALNYQMNTDLFGGGGTNYSTKFTIYELTNLYLMQNLANLGYLSTYNATGSNFRQIESGDNAISSVVDTSSYGILYIAGSAGIYQYNESTATAGTSISAKGLSGASNALLVSNNLYFTGAAGSSGVWSWSSQNLAWNGTGVINSLGIVTNNVNTLSLANGLPYFAIGSQVLVCPNGSTSSPTACISEGSSLAGTVKALTFISNPVPPYTGLYAGIVGGLYVESKDVTNAAGIAVWSKVTSVSQTVTSLATGNNNLYIGDDIGNILVISNSTPTTATVFAQVSGAPITSMIMDLSGVLYFTSGNTALYSCKTDTNTCNPILIAPLYSGVSVVNLTIGSMLVNSISSGK